MTAEEQIKALEENMKLLQGQISQLRHQLGRTEVTKQEIMEIKFQALFDNYYFMEILLRNNIPIKWQDSLRANELAIEAFNKSQTEYIAVAVPECNHTITLKP